MGTEDYLAAQKAVGKDVLKVCDECEHTGKKKSRRCCAGKESGCNVCGLVKDSDEAERMHTLMKYLWEETKKCVVCIQRNDEPSTCKICWGLYYMTLNQTR